jgi:hypothetical protein
LYGPLPFSMMKSSSPTIPQESTSIFEAGIGSHGPFPEAHHCFCEHSVSTILLEADPPHRPCHRKLHLYSQIGQTTLGSACQEAENFPQNSLSAS